VYAVHHELATYVAPPQLRDVEAAISNLVNAAAPRPGTLDDRELARLRKYELRLKRAVARQDVGFRALLRRLEAEREQAEARLREARRIAQSRIDELQQRLDATTR
jgi:hypothetical protein